MAPEISRVIKRTGAVVPFNPDRITNAIYRAAVAVGGRDRATAEALTGQVVAILEETIPPDQYPTVEQIQDVVEKVLIENGHAKVAKAYILYREERARSRREKAARGYRQSGNIPWRKIYGVLRWSVDHDLYTVEQLNTRIRKGEFSRIVREAGHHCRAFFFGQDHNDDQARRAPGAGGPEPGSVARGQLFL